jgi:DNA-binding response OmpR family regulator
MSTALFASERQDVEGHVLVVAEDLFLRKLLRQRLEDQGLYVREALTAARGLLRVHDSRPALVLLDPWIEHGRGLAFLEGLRARDDGQVVPVVLVGVEPREEVLERAHRLGATGPFSTSELGPWIERALEPEAPPEA